MSSICSSEEEGEADSFVGQSPAQQAPLYFQSPAPTSQPDPFAQVIQPDLSASPAGIRPPAPLPTFTSAPPSSMPSMSSAGPPPPRGNSLAPGRFKVNFGWVIFKLILVLNGWVISCETALWTAHVFSWFSFGKEAKIPNFFLANGVENFHFAKLCANLECGPSLSDNNNLKRAFV